MSGQELDFQEVEDGSGFQSNAVNRPAMLCPNTTTVPGGDRGTTATISTSEAPVPSIEHCTMCGSVKRRSPSSSSLQEPASKRITLQPSSSSGAAVDGGDHQLHGFTKLPLPIASPIVWTPTPSNSKPFLRRCISDAINSPGTNNLGAPNPQFSGSVSALGRFLNPQSPENATSSSEKVASASVSALLPPLPPPLRRSVSDPTSSAYQVPTTTPPRPPSARTYSPSPSSGEMGLSSVKGESPNYKRLKRMKDRLREMSQWWEEVIREGDEDSGSEDNNNIAEDERETKTDQEAVWVERTGDCLIIHFKCPCGEGYKILLSGKNCYYKLCSLST